MIKKTILILIILSIVQSTTYAAAPYVIFINATFGGATPAGIFCNLTNQDTSESMNKTGTLNGIIQFNLDEYPSDYTNGDSLSLTCNYSNNQNTQTHTVNTSVGVWFTDIILLPDLESSTGNISLHSDVHGSPYLWEQNDTGGLEINLTAYNTGGTDTNNVVVSLFINGTEVDSDTKSITAGSSTVFNFNWIVNFTGTVNITFKIDNTSIIDEWDETNNIITSTSYSVVDMPDIYVNCSRASYAGDNVTESGGSVYVRNNTVINITIPIENLNTTGGNISAGDFQIELLDNGVSTQNVSNVLTVVGEDNNVTFSYTITSVGSHTITINGDAGNEIDESDETNNNCSSTIIVNIGNLSVYIISPANATNQGNVNFTWNASTGTNLSNATCDVRLNYTDSSGGTSLINFTGVSCTTDETCYYYNGTLGIGNYSWYVNCTDIGGQSADSTTTNGTQYFSIGDFTLGTLNASTSSGVYHVGTTYNFSLSSFSWSGGFYTGTYAVGIYESNVWKDGKSYNTTASGSETIWFNYIPQTAGSITFKIGVDYNSQIDEYDESDNSATLTLTILPEVENIGGGGFSAPEEEEEPIEEEEVTGEVGSGGTNPNSGGFCTESLCGLVPNTKYNIKLQNIQTGEIEPIETKYSDRRGCIYVCVGQFDGDFWRLYEVLPVGEYKIYLNDTLRYELNISDNVSAPFGVLPKSLKVKYDGVNILYNQTRPFIVYGVSEYYIKSIKNIEFYNDYFTLFRNGNKFKYLFNASGFEFKEDEKIIYVELLISSGELEPQRIVLQVQDVSECQCVLGIFEDRVPTPLLNAPPQISDPILENFGKSICAYKIFYVLGAIFSILYLLTGKFVSQVVTWQSPKSVGKTPPSVQWQKLAGGIIGSFVVAFFITYVYIFVTFG